MQFNGKSFDEFDIWVGVVGGDNCDTECICCCCCCCCCCCWWWCWYEGGVWFEFGDDWSIKVVTEGIILATKPFIVLAVISWASFFKRTLAAAAAWWWALLKDGWWWKESGGKCRPGNAKPAAAAACRDCNKAAECSWALRLSSATDEERGSQFPWAVWGGDSGELVAEGHETVTELAVEWDGFKVQQEQRPENDGTPVNRQQRIK